VRKLGLLLAAAILPACDTETRRDNVHVTVRNSSATETVRLRIEVERSGRSDVDREVLVSPSETATFSYDDVTRLSLRAYRASDDFKIFDDFWHADDLRRLDDDVVVTVNP
jgi:hypothetical protein